MIRNQTHNEESRYIMKLKYRVITLDKTSQIEHPWTTDIDNALRQVREALKRGELAHIEAKSSS